MIDQLRVIRRLLQKHGFRPQADVVMHLIDLRQADNQTKFRYEIAEPKVWGGAGSVLDAAILSKTAQVSPDIRADEEAFCRAMISLGTEMDIEGIATARSKDAVATLRRLYPTMTPVNAMRVVK